MQGNLFQRFIVLRRKGVVAAERGADTTVSSTPAENGRSRVASRDWIWLLAMGALGVSFLFQVKNFWGSESYYNYGFSVPFLAAILFYWRFRDAPPLSPDPRRVRIGLWILAGMVVLLLPFRMLAEINPFWRVPVIAQGFLLVAGGCMIFWIRGGRKGLRHFGFATLFLLTMLPWPYRIEVKVIQEFSDQVMRLAESFLLFLGYAVEQSGNTLLFGGDKIDVNDACSGIRSIQALLMSALFMGELFRLSILNRIIQVAITIVLVLIFNSARALALTMIYMQSGHEGFDQWHDRVGLITFSCSLLALWGASLWLRPKREKRRAGPPFRWGSGLLPARFAVGYGVLVTFSLAASEGWFQFRERGQEKRPSWRLDWSRSTTVGEPREFGDEVLEILNFDYGEQRSFKLNDRRRAEVFLYGYTGEDRVRSVSTYGHSPVICMAASGIPVKARRAPLVVEGDGLRLALNHFIFGPSHLSPRGDLHAFWLVWESRFSDVPSERLTSLDYGAQLHLLAEGRRDFARQILLVSVRGARSAEEARADARRLVSEMVVRED